MIIGISCPDLIPVEKYINFLLKNPYSNYVEYFIENQKLKDNVNLKIRNYVNLNDSHIKLKEILHLEEIVNLLNFENKPGKQKEVEKEYNIAIDKIIQNSIFNLSHFRLNLFFKELKNADIVKCEPYECKYIAKLIKKSIHIRFVYTDKGLKVEDTTEKISTSFNVDNFKSYVVYFTIPEHCYEAVKTILENNANYEPARKS